MLQALAARPALSDARLRTIVAIIATIAMFVLPASSRGSTLSVSNAGEYAGESLSAFGDPETTTYGEVITVPSGEHQLRSFTFYPDVPSTLIFRPYVFKWNGSSATGEALYEGPDMHTREGGSGNEPVTATTPGLHLTEGERYVVFFSTTNNEAEDSGTGYEGSWATVSSEALGGYTYVNNGYDASNWTTRTAFEEEEGLDAWFPAGDGYGSFEFGAEYGIEAPSVTAVSPVSGLTAGTTVNISGSEFTGAREVLFGSIPATSFIVNSDGSITAVAPPGITGTVDVRVVNVEGASAATANDRVTYPAAEPASAPRSAGTPGPLPTVRSSEPCRSERVQTIRWIAPHNVRLVHLQVTLDGHHYRTLAPTARQVTVSLVGFPKGAVTVRVIASALSGARYEMVRAFHPCVDAKLPGHPASLYLRRL